MSFGRGRIAVIEELTLVRIAALRARFDIGRFSLLQCPALRTQQSRHFAANLLNTPGSVFDGKEFMRVITPAVVNIIAVEVHDTG